MKRIAWLVPGLALISMFGCSDKGGDSGAPGTGDGGAGGDGGSAECGVSVSSTWPTNGETDAYYRTDIEFQLSDVDPGNPSISLADAAGTAVDGSTSLSEDGKTVYFYPSAPLEPETSYTATLSYCTGDASIEFTTSSLGKPLTTDIVDKAYIVDLDGARFLEPAGVADLLLGQLSNSILLGVVATSPDLQMIGALSVDGGTEQDTCTPTIDFPPADFSESPYFAIGPQTTIISAAGYDIQIDNLEISGTFAADGSYFGGGVLAGQLDARALAPLVADLLGTDDPDTICATLVGFGVECKTCDSDGADYCIDVLVDDLTATELSSSLVVRTDADIKNDPACAR